MKGRIFISAALFACGAAQAEFCRAEAQEASAVRLVPAYAFPTLFTPKNPLLLNWADLPFQLHVNQSGGYNDNILGSAGSFPTITPLGVNRGGVYGDLFESTSFGASTKYDIGPQHFYADVNYGFTKYKKYSTFNTDNRLIDVGLRFQLTSRCSGTLSASSSASQQPVDQLISPGLNTVTSQSIAGSLNCRVYGGIGTILESGYDTSKNSQPLSALSDNTSVRVRGGLQYSADGLDNLSLTTQFTQRKFSDTQLATNLIFADTLAGSKTDQTDYTLSYQRTFSPKLTASASGGISQFKTEGSNTTQSLPTYSANVSYKLSEKISANLSLGHTVGAPTSVLATSQVSDNQTISLAYNFSPKLSFQAFVSRQESSGLGNLSAAIVNGASYALSNRSTSEGASANYQISPFLTASASINHTSRTYNSSLEATTNLYTVGISYNPY